MFLTRPSTRLAIFIACYVARAGKAWERGYILTVSVPTGFTDQGVMPTSSQVEESSMAGMGTYDYVKDPKV